MTAEIINLNKVRKARERAENERKADENRIRHGRSKAEREQAAAQSDLERSRLESARRTSSGPDDDLDPGTVS